jgi:hypothetical protein
MGRRGKGGFSGVGGGLVRDTFIGHEVVLHSFHLEGGNSVETASLSAAGPLNGCRRTKYKKASVVSHTKSRAAIVIARGPVALTAKNRVSTTSIFSVSLTFPFRSVALDRSIN